MNYCFCCCCFRLFPLLLNFCYCQCCRDSVKLCTKNPQQQQRQHTHTARQINTHTHTQCEMRANGSGVGFCCPRWTTSFRILLFSPQFLSLSPSRVSPLFGSLSKRRVACPVHLDRATTASASTSATSSSAGAPLPCSLLFNVLDAYWTHHSNKRIAV